MSDARKLGFVVIGRNEGARLEACLRSVLPLGQPVIYADSASDDGSPELAERLGVVAVRLAQDGKLNAARGRNAGLDALMKGCPDREFVMFLDGDCILQPGFVERALSFFDEHPRAAVVCGLRFEAHPKASIYNGVCNREWNTPVGRADACGGDALMRVEALEEVGGYDGSLLAGEEPEMTARMREQGWEIWRIGAAMTEHDARMTSFRQWWRRTQRGGFGYAQVWSVTRTLSQRLYGRQIRSAFTWTIALPAVIILAAILLHQALLLLLIPLAYCAQIFRLGMRSSGELRWASAALLVLGKIPETIGAARYFLFRQPDTIPEYKARG